ncbi:hypothetical protein TWF281_006657 [Arthrobotrys megalospora]
MFWIAIVLILVTNSETRHQVTSPTCNRFCNCNWIETRRTMPSTPSGKQPITNPSSWDGAGESSSSAASASQQGTERNGYSSSNPKVDALLAAAPRLSLQDDDSLQPPSYDDANSIRSVNLPAQPAKAQGLGVGVEDAVEFEYAFQVATSHEELATSVVRHPGSKTTILSIQRLALGSHRPNLQTGTAFKLTAVPLAANQLELSAKANPGMTLRSIKIGMLDIADDDPDIQCGMIDWADRGKGTSTVSATDLPDVFFERSYSMPPDILMFLNTFVFKPNVPRRIKAITQGIGQQGFLPRIVTGVNPILDATVAWIAIPKDSMRFDCGTFEVSSKTSPAGTVHFTKWKFPKKQPPKVFIGLTGFDRDYNRPFRYSAAITGVSHEGFSWAVRNWDDTAVAYAWNMVVSWVAIANPLNSA